MLCTIIELLKLIELRIEASCAALHVICTWKSVLAVSHVIVLNDLYIDTVSIIQSAGTVQNHYM